MGSGDCGGGWADLEEIGLIGKGKAGVGSVLQRLKRDRKGQKYKRWRSTGIIRIKARIEHENQRCVNMAAVFELLKEKLCLPCKIHIHIHHVG